MIWKLVQFILFIVEENFRRIDGEGNSDYYVNMNEGFSRPDHVCVVDTMMLVNLPVF
jgi:hypothetical protein